MVPRTRTRRPYSERIRYTSMNHICFPITRVCLSTKMRDTFELSCSNIRRALRVPFVIGRNGRYVKFVHVICLCLCPKLSLSEILNVINRTCIESECLCSSLFFPMLNSCLKLDSFFVRKREKNKCES